MIKNSWDNKRTTSFTFYYLETFMDTNSSRATTCILYNTFFQVSTNSHLFLKNCPEINSDIKLTKHTTMQASDNRIRKKIEKCYMNSQKKSKILFNLDFFAHADCELSKQK